MPNIAPKCYNEAHPYKHTTPTQRTVKTPIEQAKIAKKRPEMLQENHPSTQGRKNNAKEIVFMPKMSKQQKEEWAFFLNERNRITYNDLCRKCVHDCKQSFRVEIIECQKFISKRAKQ